MRINDKFGGYPYKFFEIFCEICVVYLLSNIPFILMALDTPIHPENNTGIISQFIEILKNEVNKGALLAFTCALIAPVVVWSFIESKKLIRTKLLWFASLVLLVGCTYLHGKQGSFAYLNSFSLYITALFIWALSVFFRLLPPEPKPASSNKEASILAHHLESLEG